MGYISPMMDVVFKRIFGQKGNEELLRGLVQAFLKVDIGEDFIIAGNDLPPDNPDEKFSRIDLHALSSVGEIDIEVQVSADANFPQRFLNYVMRLYVSGVKRGDKIYLPNPVFGLGICENTILPKTKQWFSEFEFLEVSERFPLVDNFRLCFAEVSKFKASKEVSGSERIAWMKFFQSKSEEEFAMLKETTNVREVQKAIDVLKDINTDPDMRELVLRREYNEIYKQSALSAAREEGEARIIEKMRASGMSEEQIQAILGYDGKDSDADS